MRTIEFNEDQLKDLSKIAGALFDDPNDPRSLSYKRVLNRPKINWLIVCCHLILPPSVCAAFGFLLCTLGLSTPLSITACAVTLAVYFLLTAKRVTVCAVKIYQRYAPEKLRRKCRFEPSCSEYMILAIEKYGLVKGVIKGIDRLRRCNINGGGFDMP